MKILGKYVSEWEERIVETVCKVDINTGEITDIGVEENVEDLKHHVRDYVLVGDLYEHGLEAENGTLTENGLEALEILKTNEVNL